MGLTCALCNVKFGIKAGESRPTMKKLAFGCLALKDSNSHFEHVVCNACFYSKGKEVTHDGQLTNREPRAHCTRGLGNRNN